MEKDYGAKGKNQGGPTRIKKSASERI